LEGLSDSTEEVTQNLDEQTEQLTDFAQSWSGALTAVTVGLLAATGGLLSQIPLVGQAFDGLFAILQAVALQIDQVLRPAFGFLPGLFFKIASVIGNANGVLGDLIGLFSIIVPVVLAAAGVVLVLLAKFLGLKTAIATLIGAGGLLISMLSAVAGSISLPAVAVAALVAAIGAAIAVILTDFRGWRTKGIKIIKDLWSRLKQIVLAGVNRIKEFGSNMFQAGIGLIDRLVAGIISAKNKVINAVQDIIASTPLPNLGVGANVGTAGVSGSLGTGSTSGTSSSGRTLPGSQTTTTQVFLNGRQLGQGTSGERFDESARRGQTF
jgi:hypothetical protein